MDLRFHNRKVHIVSSYLHKQMFICPGGDIYFLGDYLL